MRSKFAVAALLAVIAGVGLGQLTCRSPVCRDAIGGLCGRGHLVALAQDRGIYQVDVDLAIAELRYRNGQDEPDSNERIESNGLILSGLAAAAVAQSMGAHEAVLRSKIERELDLLRFQFRDRNTWKAVLDANSLSERSLRRIIADDLRTQRWVSRQIAPQLEVTVEECREFYQRHPETYSLPVRLRVSHLFLAAPEATPPAIVDLKKEKIESLAKRIRNRENFSELVALESEDEATKTRGGDLGFFAAYRMLPDFFAAAAKLRPGEISPPVRTSLGFHIIQATDSKPARIMTFDEVHGEIRGALERKKRQAALRRLDLDLSARARIVAEGWP